MCENHKPAPAVCVVSAFFLPLLRPDTLARWEKFRVSLKATVAVKRSKTVNFVHILKGEAIIEIHEYPLAKR